MSGVRSLSAEHLPIYANVIRPSFTTVAQEFKLTMDNCPRHTSFITDKELSNKIADNYYPFGYFLDGKLIGFVSLTKRENCIYELNHLAVLSESRHVGYGKSLIEYCKRKVNEFGGKKIIIGIIEESTILKEWYIKNGFVHVNTMRFEHLPFTVGYMEWIV